MPCSAARWSQRSYRCREKRDEKPWWSDGRQERGAAGQGWRAAAPGRLFFAAVVDVERGNESGDGYSVRRGPISQGRRGVGLPRSCSTGPRRRRSPVTGDRGGGVRWCLVAMTVLFGWIGGVFLRHREENIRIATDRFFTSGWQSV
jgi:hypothetical protein